MDNIVLQAILSESGSHNFWIKSVGIPGQKPDLHAMFTLPNLTVEFARQPNSIEIGDILFIHRIGISKIIYVAKCHSAAREATAQEISQRPFMERWPWTMELHSLTPTYGRVWAQYNVKPFTLVRQYNQLFPGEKQKLGSLQYGSGELKISPKFGEFLLQKIMDIH
jgi:hypothetical protein